MQRTTQHTVLLVEANPSLRRMIVLGLQHRGLHVIEISSPATFSASPDVLPDLMVLDIDGEAGDGHALLAQAQAHPTLSPLPVVALTWDIPVPAGMGEREMQSVTPALTCLTKPFDARALYTAIEQILFDKKEKNAARKQEDYLASRSATISPSIWPLVTAMGLLLAVIGVMFQITVSAVGLLIVVTALLCWALGSKPASDPLAV